MLAALVAVSILAIFYIRKYYDNVKRYPKGPFPLPLIGNLFQCKPTQLRQYMERAQSQYGDIFTVWTPAPIVVIMSNATIREAFESRGEDFAGRAERFPYDMYMTRKNGGVFFSQGENWIQQRRAALSIFRELGMGKNVMEAQVRSSVLECMNYLDNIEDKCAVDFKVPLQILVGNVINEFVFGYHYNFNNCKRLMDFSDTFAASLQSSSNNILVALVYHCPLFARVPFIGWYGHGQYMQRAETLLGHIREDVRRCKKTYDEHDEPSCFVHAYLQRMERNDHLTEDQMVNVCIDFFLAGMETTATVLRWAVLLMANNIEVQDKIRDEIHSVLGSDGEITMKDRKRLPYTYAAVYEILRVANIVSINALHRTVYDTKVAGKDIPHDTLIMGNIYNVMKRGEVFEEPDKFKPERFLMEDGVTPNKRTLVSVIPFSVGCRLCPGEGLAKIELFLALASILQKYRLLPPKDAPIDLTPVEAFILRPKSHKLQMVPV